MGKQFRKLSHTIYECKYHIVFCPKYRFRILKGKIAEYSKQQIYSLCRQKELVELMEMNIQKDHIHIVISIPPKYSISSIMGFLKGKLSIRLFQKYERIGKKFWGRHLWSRGYCVSTVGLDEENPVVPTKQCRSIISISYISCLLAARSEKSYPL